MSDQGNTSRNARIDDLQKALLQANDDKFFWRALTIQLVNHYVFIFEMNDHVAPIIKKETGE
jgi:hypothetical protein